jgi:hypothetical protein
MRIREEQIPYLIECLEDFICAKVQDIHSACDETGTRLGIERALLHDCIRELEVEGER